MLGERMKYILLAVVVLGAVLVEGLLTSEEQEAILKGHNCARRDKGVPDLVWDASLALSAQEWADQCIYNHSSALENNIGENLYLIYTNIPWSSTKQLLQEAVQSWLEEEEYWNCEENKCQEDTELFDCVPYTTVMWHKTTQVGCGYKQQCPDYVGDVVVCHYNPPATHATSDRPFLGEKPNAVLASFFDNCSLKLGCDNAAAPTEIGDDSDNGDDGDDGVDGDDGDDGGDGVGGDDGVGSDDSEDSEDNDEETKEESSDSGGGAIAGAVIGSLGGVALIGGAVALAMWRTKYAKKQHVRREMIVDISIPPNLHDQL
ncbi:Shell matrix protein [Balamuthia mandrillaris]